MATTKKKYKTLSTDPQIRTHEFLVDSVADLDKLPKETGSAALVASIGDIYVCNNAKEWKNISNTGIVETLEPTGTINITENGTVDVTEYATAKVNVPNTSGGSGTSFGEMQVGPIQSDTKPTVGGALSLTGLSPHYIGQSGQTPLVYVGSAIDSMVSGLYFVSDSFDNVDTVDAYVCEIEMQGSAFVYTSVTEWDGQIDPVQAEGFAFGFTMPDIGGFDPETELPVALLVFHVYKAD